MECKQNENLKNCTCTAVCSNKGICCECVAHHRENNELPGCFFTAQGEKTYNRSIENFIRLWQQKNHC